MSLRGSIVGMCNPLLDISSSVSTDLLNAYKLESNSAILAEDSHMSLYDELVEKFPVQYIAGGATQNSIRVAQWLLEEPHSTTYFGAVGKDETAKKLREVASSVGVRVEYMEVEDVPTGKCAVLLTDKHRSMVTHLGAAIKYHPSHLQQPEQWDLLKQAKVVFVSGFFLTSSAESAQLAAENAAATNQIFAFNLSAPFVAQFYKDALLKLMPYWDYVIGNEAEFEAFATAMEWNLGQNDLAEITRRVALLPKTNTKRNRVVICTHGALPTIIAHAHADGTATVTEHPVISIKPEDIVDTNGAGDAFVGGFLSQLVKDKPIEECVRAANYAAFTVIQHDGCTFPEKHSFA